MMMRNKKIIIYFCLSRFKELVFKEKKNDVMIKILIKYIIKNLLQSDLKETSDSENLQSKHIKKYAHEIISE